MKRIYFTLILLVLAMAGMAYLYFSRLNRENDYNEISLHAATANSGLIFCLHNDKSVFAILKDERLLRKLIGEEKSRQIGLLKDKIIVIPQLNNLILNENIYISFIGSKAREMDYLISTQLNDEKDKAVLISNLQLAGIKITTTAGVMKLIVNDSTAFFMSTDKNLLLLSNSISALKSVHTRTVDKNTQEFIAYIKQNNKLNKNSVGNLFLNFSRFPALISTVSPSLLNGNLAMFAHQNAFAALNYNFSNERLYFSGNTRLNVPDSYLDLFASQEPQKNDIDNLLPENTANFVLFSIPIYRQWRPALENWFIKHKEQQQIKKSIKLIEQVYHLDAETILPRYFKNQLIVFQLSSSENIGAVNLSNGDKVKQLLLDISTDYSPELKVFKVPGLLYAYFGEPFRNFKKPYYIIIDNYLVFANQPATLKNFLSSYNSSKLLENTADYTNLYTQISATSSITYYVNHHNSAAILRKNIYPAFYAHYTADKGLGTFTSMVYQLSGDKGVFQTNFLINAAPQLQETP